MQPEDGSRRRRWSPLLAGTTVLFGSGIASAGFRPLLAARTLVFFGNALGVVGLAFGVLSLPGGGAGELGAVLFARSAAQVALLLAGGVLGDRYSKIRVMLGADGVAGVTQLPIGLLVLADHNSPWLLILLASVNGGASALFLPASTGVIPELVDREQLQQANAALRVSANVSTFLGSAIAGVFVAVFGAGVTLVLNAAMYGGSVLALSRLRHRSLGRAVSANLLADLAHGWRTFVSYRWIWVIVVQAAAINALFRGATQVLGPVVADQLPRGPQYWGVVLGAQALGLLVGSSLALRYQPRFPLRVGTVCLALLGPPLLLLGLRVPILWVAVPMFVAGLAMDLFTVFWETALQATVPPEALSRVSSYDALGSFALAPLGLLAAGLLADGTVVRPVLLAAGGLVVLVALAGFAVRDVRDFRQPLRQST